MIGTGLEVYYYLNDQNVYSYIVSITISVKLSSMLFRGEPIQFACSALQFFTGLPECTVVAIKYSRYISQRLFI